MSGRCPREISNILSLLQPQHGLVPTNYGKEAATEVHFA
jgi:hypothetical protein